VASRDNKHRSTDVQRLWVAGEPTRAALGPIYP
jgi:hypothetical protein